MKNLSIYFCLCYLSVFFASKLTAQTSTPVELPWLPLELSTNMTTHIVFPFSIRSVDLGSRDILAQKAENSDNVLQVKAASENFEPSNLTVITADGTLYCFVSLYAARPNMLNISLSSPNSPITQISRGVINEREIHENCELIANQKVGRIKVKSKKYGFCAGVAQLYTQENKLYVRLVVRNSSQINYRISQVRFFMKDNKRAERTTLQQNELMPLHIDREIDNVSGQSQHDLTFVLPSFTIPDGKHLQIQILEVGGGRNLEIKLHNKHLLKAIPIQSYKP